MHHPGFPWPLFQIADIKVDFENEAVGENRMLPNVCIMEVDKD